MVRPSERAESGIGNWRRYSGDGSGRKRQVSIEGGAKPERNPNGRGLLYRSGDMMMAVDIGSCYRVLVLQEASTIKQILKAGTFYFALVFAIEFKVGTIRTLWIVPRVGVRAAELMETPIISRQ